VFFDWAGDPVRSRSTVLKKRQNSGEKDAFDRQAFLLNLKFQTSSYKDSIYKNFFTSSDNAVSHLNF